MKRKNFSNIGLILVIIGIGLDWLGVINPYVIIPMVSIGLIFLLISIYDNLKSKKK